MFVPTPPKQPEDNFNATGSEQSLPLTPEIEQALRTFVGRNADYYLPRWKSKLGNPHAFSGNNWAGFLLAGLWLPYRKMYKLTVIVHAIGLPALVFACWYFVVQRGMYETPRGIQLLIGLVIAIFVGINGNDWYLSHACRAIAKVRSQRLEKGAELRALANSGGTSVLAALGSLVLFYCVAYVIDWVFIMLFFPHG